MTPAPSKQSIMSFWEHLSELRSRVIRSVLAFVVCCIVGWEFREWMLSRLTDPFVHAWKSQGLPGEPLLHFGAPAAAFTAYFKLSMVGGAALASPVIFYQLWAFIAPGLYAKEKKFVVPFVMMASSLFAFGAYFAFRAAFPFTFGYFLGLSGQVGNTLRVVPTVMMGDYIDFVIGILVAFGVIFQIPVVVLFLSLAGIVNYKMLIRFGRWFVLLAFIAGAVLTPPDVTSQLVMAVPMCLLYVFSIGLAFVFGPRPRKLGT